MVNVSPARLLLAECRFAEAVEAYRRQIRDGIDNEWANAGGLARALMATCEFAEALPYLEKMNEYNHGLFPGNLGYEEQLSVCHWMIGERAQALDVIKGLVIAVRDGKIGYTDISGGVPYGIILCYMAITLHSRSDVDLGMKYLQKLAARRRIQYWPGPAALFLLGGLAFGDALKSATGTTDLTEARKVAGQDLMTRRHLTSLLFAAGTERRMAGDEASCKTFMAECASLANPLIEYEWYLAKGEVASPA